LHCLCPHVCSCQNGKIRSTG